MLLFSFENEFYTKDFFIVWDECTKFLCVSKKKIYQWLRKKKIMRNGWNYWNQWIKFFFAFYTNLFVCIKNAIIFFWESIHLHKKYYYFLLGINFIQKIFFILWDEWTKFLSVFIKKKIITNNIFFFVNESITLN